MPAKTLLDRAKALFSPASGAAAALAVVPLAAATDADAAQLVFEHSSISWETGGA